MLKAPRRTVERARKLRKEMSLPEILLWRELRKRPGEFKFRKQHPAGLLSLDFFCAEAKLCVEVDGDAHNRGDQPEFDGNRDAWLRLHEIETLRVAAVDVLKNLEGVIAQITETARLRLPLHQPSAGSPPRSGEEYKDIP